MTSPTTESHWDAAAEKERWRKSLEKAQQAQDQLGKRLSESSSGFYHLCLAELDAGSFLLRSDPFASRAAFLAAVRQLIAEPTTPSRPVQSIQAYRDGQKSWLEHLIKIHEQDA